ncbi:zinc ribbon domain-containing protein [Clostridium sp.]|uniref:zinc ribbon domain-containing protein n=1 Tax=Clostridium sp. TaxID=1506 RepID=UPI003F310AB9
MFCNSCGNQILEEHKFCESCGNKIARREQREITLSMDLSNEMLIEQEEIEEKAEIHKNKAFKIFNRQTFSDFSSSMYTIEINGSLIEITKKNYLAGFIPTPKKQVKILSNNLANIQLKKKIHKLNLLSAMFFGIIGINGGGAICLVFAILLFLTSFYKRIILTDNSRKKIKIRCDDLKLAEEFIEYIKGYIN